MKKSSLSFLWVLAYPVYQTIGTIRHEGAHALAALWQGATITQFVFLPSIRDGKWYWGYVRWTGTTTWATTAAPYIVDLLTVGIAIVCLRTFMKHMPWWIRLQIFIIGILSPFFNTLYNYIRGFFAPNNDVYKLLHILPSSGVHLFFVATIFFYAGVTFWIWRKSFSK